MPDTDNPYQPPANPATTPPQATRFGAALVGARRGATVGALGLGAFSTLATFVLLVFIERPRDLVSLSDWILYLLLVTAVLLTCTLFGAVVGAMVLGTIAAIRCRQP